MEGQKKTMESYGRQEKVALVLKGENLVQNQE